MFRLGYKATPHFALLFVEKVTLAQAVDEPLYVSVQRKKTSGGMFSTAFHAETSYQHTDSHNVVQFNNEFVIPITMFTKKGEKPPKKVVEVYLCSVKSSTKRYATWKFDAANLSDPNDTSVQKSTVQSSFGEASLFIRFCVKKAEEFEKSKPENFFSFITANNKKPEIENVIDNPAVSDIDVEETCGDQEIAQLQSLKPKPIQEASTELAATTDSNEKKSKHHHHHHKQEKKDKEGRSDEKKSKHHHKDKKDMTPEELEKRKEKHKKKKEAKARAALIELEQMQKNEEGQKQGEKDSQKTKNDQEQKKEEQKAVVIPENEMKTNDAKQEMIVEITKEQTLIPEEDSKAQELQLKHQKARQGNPENLKLQFQKETEERMEKLNQTTGDVKKGKIESNSSDESESQYSDANEDAQEVYVPDIAIDDELLHLLEESQHDVSFNEQQELLAQCALKKCAIDLNYAVFKYVAVSLQRSSNFSPFLINPLKEHKIFEFTCLGEDSIKQLFEPVVKGIHFACSGNYEIDETLSLLSTILSFGLALQDIAGMYTNNHISVVHSIEGSVTQLMGILMQQLSSCLGTSIASEGFEIFDQVSHNEFEKKTYLFSKAIDRFNIPESVVQAIVMSCLKNFDALLFNVLVTSASEFTEKKVTYLLSKIKEIQKMMICLSCNFPDAFIHTLSIISIVQALIAGTTPERIRSNPLLWRFVGERMKNISLPAGMDLNSISEPVTKEQLCVPLPDLGFDFTYEWLLTSSADNNYDL